MKEIRGTSPSEVGVDFVFIVTRAGFLTVLVLGLVSVISVLSGSHRAIREGRRGDLTNFYGIAYVVLIGAVITGLGSLLVYAPWRFGNIWLSVALTALSVGAVISLSCVMVVLFLRAFRFNVRRRTGPALGLTLSTAHLFALTSLLFMLVGGVALTAGQALGSRVADGKPVDLWLVRAVEVRVTAIDPSITAARTSPPHNDWLDLEPSGSARSRAESDRRFSASSRCGVLLGISDGVALISAADRGLTRLPTENIEIEVGSCARP